MTLFIKRTTDNYGIKKIKKKRNKLKTQSKNKNKQYKHIPLNKVLLFGLLDNLVHV